MIRKSANTGQSARHLVTRKFHAVITYIFACRVRSRLLRLHRFSSASKKPAYILLFLHIAKFRRKRILDISAAGAGGAVCPGTQFVEMLADGGSHLLKFFEHRNQPTPLAHFGCGDIAPPL